MPKPVIMPKFGMAQETGTVVQWLKHEGESVTQGEPLLIVTTDKVEMEVEAPASGILAGIRTGANEEIPVATEMAYILAPGESLPDQPTAGVPAVQEPRASPVARRMAVQQGVDLRRLTGSGTDGKVMRADVERYLSGGAGEAAPVASGSAALPRPRATPAARRVAREAGVDLRAVSGSGPRGRIQAADVHAVAARPAPAQPAPELVALPDEVERIPLSPTRRAIAQRMLLSVQTIPAFTVSADADITESERWREQLNAWLGSRGQEPISLTTLIARAFVWGLQRHPAFNAHLIGDVLHQYRHVHLGIAVARPKGLIVPVVRAAERMGLADLGAAIRAAVERARSDALTPDDVQGATCTISNLGTTRVDTFTALINPPQVAILAVGRRRQQFVPVGGAPVLRSLLNLTLSADHRAVDGADAAALLEDVQAALEQPGLLAL